MEVLRILAEYLRKQFGDMYSKSTRVQQDAALTRVSFFVVLPGGRILEVIIGLVDDGTSQEERDLIVSRAE